MKTDLKKIFLYRILSFAVPFVFYLITLAPDVTFIDAGELAAVASKLGIAHPTGYPLFTVLGKIFTLIPLGDEIYILNFMNAVISSAAVMMYFNLMVFVFRNLSLSKEDESYKQIPDIVIFNIALASALLLAFSKTFWDTANAVEVYSLHTFFLIINIYLFLKANGCMVSPKSGGGSCEKSWLLFAFVLGLSFTNHLSTIFLSVGFLYLYFAINGLNRISLQRILVLSIAFLLGFSFYIYFFARAENPVLSWGYPATLENFWRHFSGKQFSVWMFSSFENAGKQFSYFTRSYPEEYYYFPLLIVLPGLFTLYKKSKKLFYFTLLLFVFCILYAVNYDIYDIDSYFLLAFIITAVWIGFGLIYLYNKFGSGKKELSFAFILLCLIPLIKNYDSADESKNYFVKDYTMNVFNSAPENSIILSTQWDFWVSSSIYQQYVKNIRKDLVIIDKELLRKSWYIRHLKLHYPEIYGNSKMEFDTYLTELIKFENNTERYTIPKTETDKQDLIKIQSAFINLLNSIVDKNLHKRNFYVTFEIEQDKNERFAKDYFRIPEGLLIKYSKEKEFDNFENPEFKFTITDKTDYHHSFIMNSYFNSYLNRANYLMNHSRFEDAEKLIAKAVEIKPNAPEAAQLLQKVNQLKSLNNQEKK